MFKPPRRLLKLIAHKKTAAEMILPTFDDGGHYAYVLNMIFAAMEEFFGAGFSGIVGARRHKIGMILIEALKNAAEHGNKENPEKKIFVGFWLGKNGVLFGFRDEGEFFKEQSTKKLVESRTVLESTKEDPSGFGMEYIYEADRIYVSTKENTLYLAVLH